MIPPSERTKPASKVFATVPLNASTPFPTFAQEFAEVIAASMRSPTGATPLTLICGANADRVTIPWITGGVSTTSFTTEIGALPSNVSPTENATLGRAAPPIVRKFKLFSVLAAAVKLPPKVAAPISVRLDVGEISPLAVVVNVPPFTSTSPKTTRGGHAMLASAPVPPPPVKEKVGWLVYPEPAFVMFTPVTCPPDIVAVAVAPVPPPPVIVTVGAVAYPEPPAVTPTAPVNGVERSNVNVP